jgi:uncharacterized repeat protein (TIGR01451 family)
MYRRIILPLIICLGFAAPALAADVSLASDVKVERVVVENGEKHTALLPAVKVVPGEKLVFTTVYRNTGAKPADNFVVTNPIPAAVRLADDGFGSFEVSVDGGRQWGRLATLKVGDGKGGSRPAAAADVTHLRWVVATIAPGASGTLEYHGIVR